MVLTDYLLIVNPVAGHGLKDTRIAHAVKRLSGGARVEIVKTKGRGHAGQLADEAVKMKIPHIVAVGGDGTVNEVAGVVAGTPSALGILPMGSGNGLARELGLPVHRMDHCLEIIADGYIRDVDYGTVNGRPFFCTCGSGYDSEVAAGFAGNRVRGLGPYVRLCVQSFFHLPPKRFTAVMDGKEVAYDSVEFNCANIKQFGFGAEIAPKADLSDGALNLTVLPRMSLPAALRCGASLFTGRIDRAPGVRTTTFREMELTLPADATFHIDGDAVNVPRQLKIKCVAGGLHVFSPRPA